MPSENWPLLLEELREFFQFDDVELSRALQAPMENLDRWLLGEKKPSDFMQRDIRELAAVKLLLEELCLTAEEARIWLRTENFAFGGLSPRNFILRGGAEFGGTLKVLSHLRSFGVTSGEEIS